MSLGGSEDIKGWKIKDLRDAIAKIKKDNEKIKLTTQYINLFGSNPQPEWTLAKIKFRIDNPTTEIERLKGVKLKNKLENRLEETKGKSTKKEEGIVESLQRKKEVDEKMKSLNRSPNKSPTKKNKSNVI